MSALLARRLHELGHRRRLTRVLERLLPALARSAAVAATVVLSVRIALPVAAVAVPWVLLAALVLPLVLVPRWWRVRDAPAQVAGHLDRLCDANGVLMALHAADTTGVDDDWHERVRRPLEDLRLPPLRWRGLAPAALTLSVMVFAAWLPQRQHPPVIVAPPWAAVFAPNERQLADLAARGLLPPDQQQALQTQLERLRASASAHGLDQATWAGLDRIAQTLDAAGVQARQRLAEAAVQAERTAAATLPHLDNDLEQLTRALAELAATAPGLAQLPAEQLAGLGDALRQHAGALTPAQREALATLGISDDRALRRVDPAQAQKLARVLAQALAARRGGLGTDKEWDELMERLGQGGHTDDPPANTPLRFNHQQQTDIGAAAGLTPGAVLNADGSVTIAESVRDAATAEAAAGALARGAVQTFAPTAADARRAEVAPRHRLAVGAYFAAEKPPVSAESPAPAVPTLPASPTQNPP